MIDLGTYSKIVALNLDEWGRLPATLDSWRQLLALQLTDKCWVAMDGLKWADPDTIYLLRKDDLVSYIQYGNRLGDPGRVYAIEVEAPYKCLVRCQKYRPVLPANYRRANSALDDARWILEEFNEGWTFVQHQHIEQYVRDNDFQYSSVAIKSRSNSQNTYDYYLVEDLEQCNPHCPVCGGPLFLVDAYRAPTRLYQTSLFEMWKTTAKWFGISDKVRRRLLSAAPSELVNTNRLCSAYCLKQREKDAASQIMERTKQWVREKQERRQLIRLKALSQKTRKVLREPSLAALQSLKKEYEQEVTLPDLCPDLCPTLLRVE